MASPVNIASGGAVVDGHPYQNSGVTTLAIPTPATLIRVDRVALLADWANHQVRITRVAGTEGAGVPTITNTPGTTYYIKLAQVSITTGGVITVTDERQFAQVQTADIAAQAVTPAKIPLTSAHLLVGNGSNVSADTAITGDVTISNAGVTAIGANKVLSTMLAAPQAWQTVGSFVNSWTSVGGSYAAVAYYKDLLGVVHLNGVVNGGSSATTAFTLPAGYRPLSLQVFAVPSTGNGTNAVQVDTSGNVIPIFGVNPWSALTGISFATS